MSNPLRPPPRDPARPYEGLTTADLTQEELMRGALRGGFVEWPEDQDLITFVKTQLNNRAMREANQLARLEGWRRARR